ncbi:inhibin beta chain [Vespa velutina]|uniref:inhibin beta chain n=2 Tax=Vespa TaxID=7443 RepID=UPI001FB22775|nr:inhibin beta chain [Vespa velutina]
MHQVPYGVGLTSNEGRIAKFGEESQYCRQWHHQRQRYQQEHQHRQQQQQQSRCQPRQRDKGDNADICERSSRVFEYTERRDESTRRLHVRSPKLFSRYGGGLLIPSNLLLIGLFLCYLTLPPVQPRQNHHQTCPGCPHQQQQHQHLHEIHRGGSKHGTAPSPDDLRLEAIKHQILTKLGLRTRPDVNRTLAAVPRHLALETLYRAEAQASPQYPERTRNDHGAEYSGEFLYGGDEYSYKNLDQQNEETTTDGNSRTTTPYQGYGDYDTRPGHEPQEEMDDFYARTSEIITFAEPGRTLNGQPLLEFPMSSGEPALEPLRIKRATLWTRVEFRQTHHYQHHRQGQSNQRNITLWVFRVRCGNTTHLRGKELGEHLEMVTFLGVNVGQLGWQKFDVTKVVSNWYTANSNSPRDKLTLLVDCTGCGTHVHVSTFGGHSPHVIESSLNPKGAQDPDRPFLVVRTDPAAVKRVRRRAIECSGAIKGQCCKQRFYVSFSQLGWDDWIIAPQGYYANYCRGDCAAGHRTPDTFLNYYTHVIEEYRKMDRLAGMQPCCAPLKFSPMSLIYYGPDSNIIKRDLPKMVVDECGCP